MDMWLTRRNNHHDVLSISELPCDINKKIIPKEFSSKVAQFSTADALHCVRMTALRSRLVVFILQFVSNCAIPDHQPDVFNPPALFNSTGGDLFVQQVLGGFRRWDSIYFLFVAQHGYVYENAVAFFPLYPLLVHLMASLTNTFPALNFESWLLIAGFVVNIACFVKAAEALYGWALVVGRGRFRALAFPAVVAFCFNPASIFFSACYSESLFAFLTFSALKRMEATDPSSSGLLYKIKTACLVALSGATRSNGILNLWFIGVLQLWDLFHAVWSGQHRQTVKIFLSSALLGCIGIGPFLAFQVYAHQLFCNNFVRDTPQSLVDYAELRGYVYLRGAGGNSWERSEWCSDLIPLAYSYVQNKNWNVGFLRYYQFIQIPNFLLACPVVCLSFWSLWKLHVEKKVTALFPYCVHLGFLLFFCIFFVHIQISTRMIFSSSPLVCLIVGQLFADLAPGGVIDLMKGVFFKERSLAHSLILWYFVGFFIIGTILHCNFLPWT